MKKKREEKKTEIEKEKSRKGIKREKADGKKAEK